jgi:hypothetical protein
MKINAEFGCFVRTSGQVPCCRLCDKPLEVGDAFARIYINSYANPHFHGDCLKHTAAQVDIEHAKLDQYKEEYAKEQAEKLAIREAAKAKTAAANEELNFRKKIIKDALKSTVKVSKLSIIHSGSSWDGVFKGRAKPADRFKIAKPNKEYWNEPAIIWVFIGGSEVAIQPGGPPYDPEFGPTMSHLNLADPNAITKMGNMMLEIGGKAWDPYLKKVKK